MVKTVEQITMDWDNLRPELTEMSLKDFLAMSHDGRVDYLYEDRYERIYNAYLKWLKEVPEILERFIDRAEGLWLAGWRNYSQWAIVGVMRYHHDLQKGPGQQFKICNGFISFMARDYILIHPERFGFFTLRKLGKR